MAQDEVSNSQIGDRETIVDNDIAFHPAQASLAAANFNMPALSPTMTEGNIATWKIKEGTADPTTSTSQTNNERAIRTHTSDMKEHE
jgi:hypothetical protein